MAANHSQTKQFVPDVELEMIAVEKSIQMFNGKKTTVYSYEYEPVKGSEDHLHSLSNSYLGPIIKVKQNQKIRITFKNRLPRKSIIHWHGLHVPPNMDGHPVHAINNQEQYVYEFEVTNRPGTYWFHPHPDKITGPQVYYGLAGLFIVEDENSDLPSAEYDMPLIIQDRRFDLDNQLTYLEENSMSQMHGFLGNEILINGSIKKGKDVQKASYRFRILNGSNSRIYKLSWDDGEDIKVIGTDAGLLESPVARPYLMVAPGERVEIWKSFNNHKTGDRVTLKSLTFDDGSNMGMGNGMMENRNQIMMQSNEYPNGIEFDLYTFTVNAQQGPNKKLPSHFSSIDSISPDDAINRNNPRKFRFYNEHMNWVINGKTFEMLEVADWEQVSLNTTEIWQFINGNGKQRGMGMMQNMMQMPHPVHLHGLSFQIIERDVSEVNAESWQTMKNGFVDEGWQDTFLLLPGMKVRIIMRFLDYKGKYIYHCHNLEHEDMGMMRNFEIL